MTDAPQEDRRTAGPVALRAVAAAPAGTPPSVAEPEEEPAPRRRSRRRKKGAKAPPPAAVSAEVRPARPRFRHWMGLASLLLLVALPLAATVGYLWTRAADQYHSLVAFSIRSEDPGSAASGLLGAITQIGSASASDPDIVFEYIRSQKIVEEIDAAIDLRAIYSRPEGDPVFTLAPDATIEDLLAQWNRMVEVSFESASGIIHVRANAFTPGEARMIAQAVLDKSGDLVNRLSEQAREDAVRFAREDFDFAENNLREVRERLADFRRENRIVDPSADVAGQMGLLNALQGELAQALVDRDMLLSYATRDDQRVVQANRRITAISERIEEERSSLGIGGGAAVPGSQGALTEVIGDYEELLVDLEFANSAYTQTLAGLISARAEARRQSRYLTPHIQPTLAERPLYPRRALIGALVGLFLLLGWGILMLLYYNVRDNR